MTFSIVIFIAFSIIISGTFAWIVLTQRAMNVFTFDPPETDDDDDPYVPPVLSSLTVTKTVDGEDADYGKLFVFDVIIGGNRQSISLGHGGSHTFNNIPVGTVYRVTEQNYTADGYSTSSAGASGTIVRAGSIAAFTNTKEEEDDEDEEGATGDLTISKVVTGENINRVSRFRFTVTIGGEVHELDIGDGESFTFTGIPVGTSFDVYEDGNASRLYNIYTNGSSGTITESGVVAVFENEHLGEPRVPDYWDNMVEIVGGKTWVHGSNSDLPQRITVYVMNGAMIAALKVVTAEDNWQYAFSLPRYDADWYEIVYNISEEPVRNYTMSVSGYDLTNTHLSAGPRTGDDRLIWIWFIVILVASVGLRIAVFWRKKKKKKK